MKVDGHDNAIIGAQFIDTVSQNDSIFVARFSTGGTPLWGINGVTLGTGLSPTLCVTPDNNVIVESRGHAALWKLNGNTGAPVWPAPLAFDLNATNCTLVTTPTNDFIAVFFKPASNFQYGFVYAMKFDSTGAQKWNNTITTTNQVAAVYDAIQAVPDSAGGFYLGMTSYTAFNQDVFARHIDASGNQLWDSTGVEVSTDSLMLKFMSGIVFSNSLQSLYVLTSTADLNQNYYGINLQKLDGTGARKFTNHGYQTQPVDSSMTEGGLVLEDDALIYMYVNDSNQIKTDKVDLNGNIIRQQKFLCTQTSSKLNPALGLYKNNRFVAVWEDDRNGTSGIYAQSFADTGGALPVSNISEETFTLSAFPNPSGHGQLSLKFNTAELQNTTMAVSDITGKVIYSTEITLTPGQSIYNINLPEICSGIYIIRIRTADTLRSLKWICGG